MKAAHPNRRPLSVNDEGQWEPVSYRLGFAIAKISKNIRTWISSSI